MYTLREIQLNNTSQKEFSVLMKMKFTLNESKVKVARRLVIFESFLHILRSKLVDFSDGFQMECMLGNELLKFRVKDRFMRLLRGLRHVLFGKTSINMYRVLTNSF